MGILFRVLALAVLGGAFIAPVWSGPPAARPGQKRPDPDRLKGIKAAVADIEAGKLRLKSGPVPAAAWQGEYVNLLKKDCGVDWETVRDFTGKAGIQMEGYNDLMILEIEHRFGKGILKRLQKQAEAASRKAK